MSKAHRRPWIVALIALALVAALGVGWGVRQQRLARRQADLLEATYQRVFFALTERVENTELLLSKALASGVPARQAVILARVHAEATAAQNALASLPVGFRLQRSQQFLAQLGDFSYTVAEDVAAGRAPRAEQWEQLARLKARASGLMHDLAEVRDRALEGRFRWTEVEPRAVAVAAEDNAGGPADSLAEMDRELQEVPALIYDGPFSEQNLRPEPRTDPGDQVTREQATRRALEFVLGDDAEGWRAEQQGEATGPIAAYALSLEPPDDRRQPPVSVHVSQEGGHVLWFLRHRAAGQERLDVEEARRRARAFLRRRDLGAFVNTGWVREEGTITFNFARTVARAGGKGRITLYPEMLKLTVGADDGRVLGYDARTFWLNRDPARDAVQPALSADDARALISPLLEVEEVGLAVIPLPSGRQTLTYEVRASLSGDPFLLYYNARSGREELILRVMEAQGNRLTF